MEHLKIQYIAIIGSILLLLFILYLIRQKRLKVEYALLWLFFAVVFIIFSFWRKGLDWLSDLLGIVYPPAALFLLLLMAAFVIMIEFSVILSRHSDWIRKAGQDIALMKKEIEKLKEAEKNK